MTNNICFYLAFTITSITLYTFARLSKFAFSGENYTPLKFWLSFICNFTIMFIHLRFVRTGKLPFIGPTENSVMGWLSMLMTVLHACSLPVHRHRKSWLKRRKFDPRL